jgi:hypothetical protein
MSASADIDGGRTLIARPGTPGEGRVFVLIARPSWARAIALSVAIALVLTSCGSQQGDESGVVSAETVKQLEDVLHARASAIANGDRGAFLATIDTTRPTFRRIQLREFDYPTVRGTLDSTFKISKAERYRGYVRGFVEETLEGNFFSGAFNGGRAYYRHYFRSEGGKWILTEPTGDETGPEKKKVSGLVEIGYWALDEDVSDVLLRSLAEAHDFARAQATKPFERKLVIRFIPTAEIAGPGWDAFSAGGGPPGNETLTPWWWAFDETRSQVSAYTQFTLRRSALVLLRESVAPGIAGRLLSDPWLDEGWYNFATGLDVSGTVRQSCAGVAIPTLRELQAGMPPLGEPGVSPDVYGRFSGYATSMVAFLYDRYGVDAYWSLMLAYLQSTSAAVNFPKVLQVTPDEFYAAWLVWLKKKYC